VRHFVSAKLIRDAERPRCESIAAPAQYGNSGVMTFMVNCDGVLSSSCRSKFGRRVGALA
jgi:hypothetical protein